MDKDTERKEAGAEEAQEVVRARKDEEVVAYVEKDEDGVAHDVATLAAGLGLQAVRVCPRGWIVYDGSREYLGLLSFSERVGCYKATSSLLDGQTYGQLQHLLLLFARLARNSGRC